MSPISQRFPIPTNDDDFERLCRDVLRFHWSRPGLEIFGKRGERQFGIDLLDLSGQEPLFAAQCKLKEEHKSLLPGEIETEVNKAKLFIPRLDKYGILTTGKVSTRAQRKIRELNQAHKSIGLFEIELFTWEKLCELIQLYPDVHEEHYGEIATGRGVRIEKAVIQVQQGIASLTSRVEGDEIDTLINEARDAVNRHDYQMATLLLNRIEQKKGHQLSPAQRFRVISNRGFAVLGQGKPKQAANCFLEAQSWQPDDEKARTNEVLAYYLIGDFATAYSKADKIRSLYPASTRLAAYWVLSAPPEKSTGALERELSSILLTDIQVRTALASKALSRQELDAAEAHADVAVKSDPSRGHPQLVLAQVNMARLVNLETGPGGSSSVPRAVLVERGEQHARQAIRFAETEKDIQTQVEAHVLLVDILLLSNKKQEATDEANRAYQLSPDNIQTLLARSQTQFANEQITEGMASLERAYVLEPRADVAFSYGNALFNRSKDSDLETAIEVLTGIDLTSVIPAMRPAIATQTLKTLIKKKDWEKASLYLDRIESQLSPETVSSLRGFLAHYQGLLQEAERHALQAQSLLSASSSIEVKIFLARLFMLIGRSADALPLFQQAFEANLSVFDPGNLLDCAARLHRDDVVIDTFRTLRKRGVNDWNTVSFGVQYLQKYHPQEAVDVLDSFLKDDPHHKLAKLSRSVIGLLTNRPELVNGSIADLPDVEELPVEYATQVVHVLRFVKNPDAAVDYAYRYLRLHFSEPQAHRAFLISMTPFEPLPSIPPTLDTVGVGAAVRYEELPQGDPKWVVIDKIDHPSLEFEEITAESTIALELMGKRVNETFLLAPGMIDRRAVIRQIVPKYVRRYNDCGDAWQIRFPGEPMIEAVHLGSTEEQIRESIELILKTLQKRAETEVEMRRTYSTVSTPLHVFGTWHGKNAYIALINLAIQDEQPVRNSFGTLEERNESWTALQTAGCLVVDLSTLATLRLLGIEHVLTTTRFRFLVTENTWRELRETLDDRSASASPSIAIGFQDGIQVAHEETVEFKQKRDQENQTFLDLVQKHCQVVPVLELASLDPTKREAFEKGFGQYGVESMLLGAKPDCVLWSDDLVQAHIAVTEFGARRCWTQIVIAFLADLGLLQAKERDIATAKLIGMEYHITIFDCAAIIEAVHLTDAAPWRLPLKNFIREFAAPNADIKSLLPILAELVVRIYREPLLPESRCKVITAFLDAIWKNPAARRGILTLRANSPRLFGINSVGASQFNDCFDHWLKLIENPIIPGS
jgi:tetratricopeptide (TPR) repeat protein